MKRFVSVLLCVLLLFSLAVPAFAEGDVINNYTNETDLTPVTSWLRDLYDSLNERLTHVGNNIAEGFNALYDTLRTVMDNVKMAITNSIDALKTSIKTLGEEIKGKLGDISTKVSDNFTVLFNQIKTHAENIRDGIVSSVDAFVDKFNKFRADWFTRFSNYEMSMKNHLITQLEFYFVPTFSFQEQVETWKSMLEEKFGFYTQISNMLNRIFNFSETTDAPKFEITYRGTTVGIVDFSAYAYMRSFVQGLILFFSWFAFLRRLYCSVPDFIMGMGYSGSSRNDRPVSSGGHSRERTVYSYMDGGQRYDVISKR